MRKNDIDVEMTESDTLRKNNKTSSTMILHSGGIKGNVDGGKNNILVDGLRPGGTMEDTMKLQGPQGRQEAQSLDS